jgi:flagellin
LNSVVGLATVTASGVAANSMSTMTDVVREIQADLGDVATVAYDAAKGQMTFAATNGTAGTGNTISLSGAGLAAVQFGGTLAATGAAGNATASKLSDINVLTTAAATSALGSIDNSIEYVSKQRALLGAIENRLAHTVNNLTNIVTNTSASRSAIEDTDYSKETSALAKSQIITQAATAMLAQANQSAQSVLSLLK